MDRSRHLGSISSNSPPEIPSYCAQYTRERIMTILTFLRDNARWLSAGMLLTFLSSFGQTYFISIFAGEIREVFQISHGQWGGIYAVGTSASAAVMVWAGGLTDHFRVRSLGVVFLVMLAGACLSMAISAGPPGVARWPRKKKT